MEWVTAAEATVAEVISEEEAAISEAAPTLAEAAEEGTSAAAPVADTLAEAVSEVTEAREGRAAPEDTAVHPDRISTPEDIAEHPDRMSAPDFTLGRMFTPRPAAVFPDMCVLPL